MPKETEHSPEPKAPAKAEQIYLINLDDHTSVSVSASSVEEAQHKAKALKE